jgi:hypothetical protein
VPDVIAYVSGGHVFCQVDRVDRDVQFCVGCQRLKQVNEKSSPPYIVCDLKDVSQSASVDPQFVVWWFEHHRPRR